MLGRGVVACGVAGLLVTAACGSRTSMLDPDAYDVSQSEGGSSTRPSGNAGKPSSNAGKPSSSAAGATSTPSGGASNSTVDPGLAVQPCQQYCPGYGTQCKKRLKGQDCLSTCQAELNSSGATCQALGVKTLACLGPFFSPNGGNCDGAVNRALTKCQGIVAEFEKCKDLAASTSGNDPSLDFFASCQRDGGPMDDGSCTQIFTCANGPYITFCNWAQDGTMLLDCTCATPKGEAFNGRLTHSADACLNATALCGGPRL